MTQRFYRLDGFPAVKDSRPLILLPEFLPTDFWVKGIGQGREIDSDIIIRNTPMP